VNSNAEGPVPFGGTEVPNSIVFEVRERWPLEQQWIQHRTLSWIADGNTLLLVEDCIDRTTTAGLPKVTNQSAMTTRAQRCSSAAPNPADK